MIRLAAIQMNSRQDVEENKKKATEFLYTAAEQRAKLAVLPEHFLYLGP